MIDVNVAVIYYSSTGNVHLLAEAVAEGAAKAGAHLRVHRVPELAPEVAIDANPEWRAHVDRTREVVPEATLDDLAWADAYAFGTPTRFGPLAAQLKQFLDQTGGLWRDGILADKPVTGFTSSINRHGGQETTIVSLYNMVCHWGAIIVARLPATVDAPVTAGEEQAFAVAGRRLRFFAAETGVRVSGVRL